MVVVTEFSGQKLISRYVAKKVFILFIPPQTSCRRIPVKFLFRVFRVFRG